MMAALTAAFAILAPLLFGPALTPLVHALGAQVEHRCACGMAPGECGCSVCARVERERRESARRPLVRSGCEDDDGLPALGSLAPYVDSFAGVDIVSPPAFMFVRDRVPPARSRGPDEPARPPPKVLVAASAASFGLQRTHHSYSEIHHEYA